MKVLILSDLHFEVAPFELEPDLQFDVVILAGDVHSLAKRAVQWAVDRFRGNLSGYLNRFLSRHGEVEKDLNPGHAIDG